MLIVNFVPLPNFGEINIDKNFSFIYPSRAHNPRVTKYGHHTPVIWVPVTSLQLQPRGRRPPRHIRKLPPVAAPRPCGAAAPT